MIEDKYPTKENLKFIESYDTTKKPVEHLLDYLENIWWAADWGFIKKGKKVVYLQLHTGGWSGNEDIIRALQRNEWFFFPYWQKSTIGGHYWFKIPLKKGGKK